jgi:hypothetical protein
MDSTIVQSCAIDNSHYLFLHRSKTWRRPASTIQGPCPYSDTYLHFVYINSLPSEGYSQVLPYPRKISIISLIGTRVTVSRYQMPRRMYSQISTLSTTVYVGCPSATTIGYSRVFWISTRSPSAPRSYHMSWHRTYSLNTSGTFVFYFRIVCLLNYSRSAPPFPRKFQILTRCANNTRLLALWHYSICRPCSLELRPTATGISRKIPNG